MNVFLMYCDRDFAFPQKLVRNGQEVVADLELETLFHSMAGGDEFLHQVVQNALLESLNNPKEILYRQAVLADCVEHSETVKTIYTMAVEAIEREKKVWNWTLPNYPQGTLNRAIEVLQIFAESLRRLRKVANETSSIFKSDGFTRFFAMLSAELGDDYLEEVDLHLKELMFDRGLLMRARLGEGAKCEDYVLLRNNRGPRGWRERLKAWIKGLASKKRETFTYQVHGRDESGLRILGGMKSRGIEHVAASLAQSADHILNFFQQLRVDLGFYMGCLNLREQLLQRGASLCIPVPTPAFDTALEYAGLYDVCLRLLSQLKVVQNYADSKGRHLVMITGANRGGKSTLLRGLGIAQLMMQSGMFVAATVFRANVCNGVYTHFKRQEDSNLKSGKLDEELARMSELIDKLKPGAMLLCNESFASTNEREGSEIAREIVRALLEMRIKVIYVTHMFDLAQYFYVQAKDSALFLRAERLSDESRTFRLLEGEPLPTSYGADLYRRIFQPEQEKSAA